jgi:hypothetical protein
MPVLSSKKPYRIGRSRTGLGLFATKRIKKGSKIVRYFGPLLDSKKKKDDAIENKYLFELNNRWTIDGSVRENVARYINHACRPNAESDVRPRKRRVFIRAIRNIEPGDEINYDYGTDYFKAYLKPIGCKCDACEKKRKKKRAEARAERLRLKAKELKKAERKARKKAEKAAAKRAKAKSLAAKAELKPDRKRKLDSKPKRSTKTPTRTPTVRLKTGTMPVKRKATAGVHLNGGASNRRSRPKSATSKHTTMVTAEQPVAANLEAPTFQASSLAVPAATVNEAQQASA